MNKIERQRQDSIDALEKEITRAGEWRKICVDSAQAIRDAAATQTPHVRARMNDAAAEIDRQVEDIDRKVSQRVQRVETLKRAMGAATQGHGALVCPEPDISNRGYDSSTSGSGAAPVDPSFSKIMSAANG